MPTKTCARCGKPFTAKRHDGFRTCSDCRRPLPVEPGGCSYWQSLRLSNTADLVRDYSAMMSYTTRGLNK